MDARDIIARLRRGDPVGEAALRWFAKGIADGTVSDAQAGAFAMGVCLRGLTDAERVALTEAMRDSGQRMTWDVSGPVLDKHSTGGLGDCVSLVLAPALAACGAYVPMIAGRGLGHTGGTLDKMEAIPGLVTGVSEERLREIVTEVGCAIVGAGADLAPADKRLYAIRDVSATVESVDLITASILSKKLAAGLEGLVLDVKCGSGAFMKTRDEARRLAEALVATANGAGCATRAVLSDMSQPLAANIGNALEVVSSMEVLCDGAKGPLRDLSVALGGILLESSGLAGDAEAGAAQMERALASGAAAERFGQMVAMMGGPLRFAEDWRRFLPEAPVIREVVAPEAGYIAAMEGEALGLAVVALGGGRQVESDKVDPAVGLSDMVRIGGWVEKGAPICRVHAAQENAAEAAEAAVLRAIVIAAEAPEKPELILERVG